MEPFLVISRQVVAFQAFTQEYLKFRLAFRVEAEKTHSRVIEEWVLGNG